MSSYLVTLNSSRFVTVLLHDSNGAVVSSHMQSVIDSCSLPHTVAMCAGSFYKQSQNSHAKSCPFRSELSSVEEGEQTHICASHKNAYNEDLMGTRV
jgi:hypothetical protein